MTIPPCFICTENGVAHYLARRCRRFEHREIAILELLNQCRPEDRIEPARQPYRHRVTAPKALFGRIARVAA